MVAPPVTGADLVAAARALLGTRYRLHGRDPSTGLDCLGLIAAALARCGHGIVLPGRYELRSSHPLEDEAYLAPAGLVRADGREAAGDIELLRVSPGQFHAAILTGRARDAIHAHAGLRRVVEAPLPSSWRSLERWRLPPS
ncbi:C40 family peptidase [Novosphingobium profundi]|uniref:hypothetical protein n=1 Tax=Novosphingobium profundi TaxID=1774954 RepID=UPI001BD93E7B|nr:hypothetical protein [Novosphingobium profundi]MBT0667768.1 C40 family peptidase [Novosphingobium profundi]